MTERMESLDACDHLHEIRQLLGDQRISRWKVRYLCMEQGWNYPDEAYRRLVNGEGLEPPARNLTEHYDRKGQEPPVEAGAYLKYDDLAAMANIRTSPFMPSNTAVVMHPDTLGSLLGKRAALADSILNKPPDYMPTPPTKRMGSVPPSPLKVCEVKTLHWSAPFAVFSDLHIPSHDADFLNRAIDKALAEGCRRFIIAGDLTDNNQWHKRTHDIRTERRWQDDIVLARSVLGSICADFDGGVVFFGNHDEWIMKATRGQMDTDWLYAHLFPELPIEWTYKRQIRVVAGNRHWRILHGEQFSAANPLGIAERYALKFQENVIMGHQHYAVAGETGPYQCIVAGGCFDNRRQDYLHEGPKTYRQTQAGFVIVKDGYGTLYRASDPTW